MIDISPWIGRTALSSPGAEYQWTRDGVAIEGAASQSYVYVAADIGPSIRCVVDGVASAPVQAYFDDITGLAACWDTRDLTVGAFASWADRASGLVLSGSGARSESGVSFSSGASLAALPAMTGAHGITSLFAAVDEQASGSIWEYGDLTTEGAGVRVVGRSLRHAIRGSARSEFYVMDSLDSAAVWCTIGDFWLTSSEAFQIFRDGVVMPSSLAAYGDNPVSTVFGEHGLRVASGWAGELRGALVIYARPLTWDERQHAELVLGYLSGISVSTPARVTAGIAFGLGGQSNSTGIDEDLSALPSPWPPADTAASLREVTSAPEMMPSPWPPSTSAAVHALDASAGVVALVEPVNGAGGTHAVAFADAVIRDAGYSHHDAVAIVPAPPVPGTAIAAWMPGTANYRSMMSRMRTAKVLGGYELGGLLWYQGESDGDSEAEASAYVANAQMLFDQLRADLDEPNLPIVVVRIHASQPAGYTHWETVRTSQDALADEDTVVVASSGALIDEFHLSSSAQKALGAAMASAYLARW